jgi:hypothetical protein
VRAFRVLRKLASAGARGSRARDRPPRGRRRRRGSRDTTRSRLATCSAGAHRARRFRGSRPEAGRDHRGRAPLSGDRPRRRRSAGACRKPPVHQTRESRLVHRQEKPRPQGAVPFRCRLHAPRGAPAFPARTCDLRPRDRTWPAAPSVRSAARRAPTAQTSQISSEAVAGARTRLCRTPQLPPGRGSRPPQEQAGEPVQAEAQARVQAPASKRPEEAAREPAAAWEPVRAAPRVPAEGWGRLPVAEATSADRRTSRSRPRGYRGARKARRAPPRPTLPRRRPPHPRRRGRHDGRAASRGE